MIRTTVLNITAINDRPIVFAIKLSFFCGICVELDEVCLSRNKQGRGGSIKIQSCITCFARLPAPIPFESRRPQCPRLAAAMGFARQNPGDFRLKMTCEWRPRALDEVAKQQTTSLPLFTLLLKHSCVISKTLPGLSCIDRTAPRRGYPAGRSGRLNDSLSYASHALAS